MAEPLCVVRGGGDLGTGVVWRLHRAGFPVIVTELAEPLTVRRTVAVSTAVTEGSITIEGMRALRADDSSEARSVAEEGIVAVLVSDELPDVGAEVVVDARMAKRNLGTRISDAPLVVTLGPGFTAGVDCHAVVETQRGHHLGRVLWSGSAAPDTGTPGVVRGQGRERVLRAEVDGAAEWGVAIGDAVQRDHVLGRVGTAEILAPFDGVVRGLIAPGTRVRAGLKVGDIDPRGDVSYCYSISDKALAIGGGVLEAVTSWRAGAAPVRRA